MIRKVLFIAGMFGLLTSLHADKVNLNVFASRFDSIPIAVIDFNTHGRAIASEKQPGAIIANDLDLCGRFHVVRSAAFDSATFVAQNIALYINGDVSESGGRVSFTCNVNDVANRAQLFTKQYSGPESSVRSLAHQFSNDLYSVLYGDRGIFDTRVLCSVAHSGGKDIAIMDFDGYNRRQIEHAGVLNLFPAFADSNSFVYVSYLKGKPDIYWASLAGGAPKVVAASRGVQTSPAISPVDRTVVYASSIRGNMDIYTCALDGSGKKPITASGTVETAPCWSPNGYQIAFTSDRPGNPQIYVMDADGGNQHRITHRCGYCDSPAWSPKGDRIAFTGMASDGKLDIWVVSPDGTNEVQLTNAPGHHEYPTWSRDGQLIGFISRSGGKSNFCVMRFDGSHVRQVTNTGDVGMPDWQYF